MAGMDLPEYLKGKDIPVDLIDGKKENSEE
jgi:hypothetical protein